MLANIVRILAAHFCNSTYCSGHGNICEYRKPCRNNGTCSPLPPIMFEHSNNVQKICQLRSLKCWPVYKYEIFLNYTSTLQKKATHLCLDMPAVPRLTKTGYLYSLILCY
ncbi:hypothetical protein BgiBS90_034917 [Biomphalaria glabrata]|nr:hypothetical protein BgiBS90_034917 [Biomphalaria glabrata]